MRMNDSRDAERRNNRITIRPAAADGLAEKAGAGGDPKEEAGMMRQTLELLSARLERLSIDMDKSNFREYVELAHRPWMLIWRNFVSGLSRGIGIALGFTFFAATIVWVLQVLGKLNLPIVGDYIADIVRIVQRQLQINPY